MNQTKLPEISDDALNKSRLSRAESARLNGAKSKGPMTAAGKAKSSQNALRHGLTSKRIMPLLGPSREREDYEHFLRGLKAEYDPQTATELYLVETIARDLVRHGRIGQVSDAILQPYSHDGFTKPAQTLSEILFEHDAFEAALASLDESDRIELNREQAIVVRNCVLALLRNGGAAPDEAAHKRDLLARSGVDPGLLRLHDPARMMQVLGGRTELTDKELKQWTAVLRLLDNQAISRMPKTVYDDHEHERQCRRAVIGNADELPHLNRVLEIEAKNSRGLQRNIELLMRLKRKRQAAA